MARQKIIKDTPLSEITLRKYERPKGLTKRDLVRKFCLTVGLLQPGDSRDVVVDVLYVMLENPSNKLLSSRDIEQRVKDVRQEHSLELLGVAPSNIRRQLLRCRELFLIEKIKASYRITENLSFSDIFKEKLKDYYLKSIIDRTQEYMSSIDDAFPEYKKEK
ncbi:MAG: hypothetical protein ACQESC_02640 [Nanobdellota archaeon]